MAIHHKRTIIILLVAVALRLIFTFGLWHSGQPLVSLRGDALNYIQTAKNFLEKGIWSADTNPAPKPDNGRTPVYPLFLALFLHFDIPFLYMGFLQDIIAIFVAVLLYRFGRKIFPDSAAFAAGLFFAADPYIASVYNSKAIMTESFATLFLAVAFLSLAIFIKTNHTRFLLTGSSFLVLAALTKPQFLYFGIFIPVALLLAHFNFRKMILAFLLYGLLLSPWLYYNFIILRVYQFSSIADATIFVTACDFENWRTGKQYLQEGENCVKRSENLFNISEASNNVIIYNQKNAELAAAAGRKIILNHPLAFAFYHIIHIPRLFYHDITFEAVAETFGRPFDWGKGEMDINLVKKALKGDWAYVAKMVINRPVWLLTLSYKFFLLIFGILAIIQPWLRKRLDGLFPRSMFILFLPIALCAIMVSPIGMHRYRVPIEPLILILAFDAVYCIFHLSKLSSKNNGLATNKL